MERKRNVSLIHCNQMYENADEEEENMSFFLFFEIVCKLEKTGAKKRFADIKN